LTRLDPGHAEHWSTLRTALRTRLSSTFTPEMMAVDGADRPVAGAGSQLGWLLWSGVLDEHTAEAAADRLVRPDVLTDFGVRTLSVDHPRFGPALYHRGAVWPFDNWIAWGALRAMGRSADADRIRTGVLKAVRKLGRYPELYAVHTSGQLLAVPVANQISRRLVRCW